MKDETYAFVQDVREKKNIARSARNRRTHAGKGGAVKFPSDFMTRKELNAMNGKVIAYKLNAPMTWEEFKALPDDVKVTYITALRHQFGVSDSKVAEMMGANQCAFSKKMRELGLGLGRNQKRAAFDKDGWYAWSNSVKTKQNTAEEVTEAPAEDAQVSEVVPDPDFVVPCSGKLEFECPADQALFIARQLLGNRKVNILISWDTVGGGNND